MEQVINVVFRADASLAIGSGHVIRCLTLASALRDQDIAALFVCREHDGHLCDLIEERGFAVRRLLAPKPDYRAEDTLAHATWLGCHWQEDAEQSRAAIETLGAKPDWLVVDHYALDQRWESTLRASVRHIMVIDDLADRTHNCDLLLDQNLVAQMHTRYGDKVPDACGMLLGPEYALLQSIYAELHERMPPRHGPIRRIFIFFGGADSENLTGRTLAAFLSLNQPDIEVDVVIASGCKHAKANRQLMEGHANIHLHSSLSTLAPLMAKADLAIGACGATSWERLCLGLPALVVTLADNQRSIADELSRRDLIHWLGHKDELDGSTFSRTLGEFVQKNLDEAWSNRCLAIVDGKGVNRICAALTVTASTSLHGRHARLQDESRLLEWASDPRPRLNMLTPRSVNAALWRKRFRAHLRDLASSRLYVVETNDGIPVGQVRFDRVENAWRTNFALAPCFRGRELDRPLLQAALLKLRQDTSGVLDLARVTETRQLFCEASDFRVPEGHTELMPRLSISVCSDEKSWINSSIADLLLSWLEAGHQVNWAHDATALRPSDICFYLSYGCIVDLEVLARHTNNLVVHESDLPMGRGWSPLVWQVLEGKNSIPVTLFEAEQAVDSGIIYLQNSIELTGHELAPDLRQQQADATLRLCKTFVAAYPDVLKYGRPQSGEASYYPRRSAIDSELDPDRTLREQFNLLRVCDNQRYPAWFELGGVKFTLKIAEY